jgi:hypothetical protein
VLTLSFTPGTSKGEDLDFGAGDTRNTAPSRSASSSTEAKFLALPSKYKPSYGYDLEGLKLETPSSLVQHAVQTQDWCPLVYRASYNLGVIRVNIQLVRKLRSLAQR